MTDEPYIVIQDEQAKEADPIAEWSRVLPFNAQTDIPTKFAYSQQMLLSTLINENNQNRPYPSFSLTHCIAFYVQNARSCALFQLVMNKD